MSKLVGRVLPPGARRPARVRGRGDALRQRLRPAAGSEVGGRRGLDLRLPPAGQASSSPSSATAGRPATTSSCRTWPGPTSWPARVPLPRAPASSTRPPSTSPPRVQRNVLELAEAVGQVMGRKPELEFAPPRPGELFRSALDISKAKAVLGWAPEWKFEDGLRPAGGVVQEGGRGDPSGRRRRSALRRSSWSSPRASRPRSSSSSPRSSPWSPGSSSS